MISYDKGTCTLNMTDGIHYLDTCEVDYTQSHYRKAYYEVKGNVVTLYSYNTPICAVDYEHMTIERIWGGRSATTGRHIHSFLYQALGVALTSEVYYSLPVYEMVGVSDFPYYGSFYKGEIIY